MIYQGITWAEDTPIPARTHKVRIQLIDVDGLILISTNNTAAKNNMPII
jgi:hypothetical protein